MCRSIRVYLVGSPLILGSMGVRKSERTPSILLVALTIFSCTLGGIGDGFILWD